MTQIGDASVQTVDDSEGVVWRRKGSAAGRYWRLAEPAMRGGNGGEPVGYAHLQYRSANESLTGILFVTTRRLIWVTMEPGEPAVPSLILSLAQIHDVLNAGEDAGRGAFALHLALDVEEGVVVFQPARPKSRASIVLAEHLADSIRTTKAAVA